MSSDHLPRTPKRQLPKWPFWLGDALLVTTGVALAFANGGGELTPAAMGIVVTAIALGALVACAPYLAEHFAEAIRMGKGGDWGEIRNQVLKLEFRLAELELNGGQAPESARLAHSRWTEDEADLGVGEVKKQPTAPSPSSGAEAPANPHFNFAAKGPALAAAEKPESNPRPAAPEQRAREIREQLELESGPIESDTGVGPARPQRPKAAPPPRPEEENRDDEEAEDLPTSLDELGPAETGKSTHLRKALDHARKRPANGHVQRLIQGGKRPAG